MLGAQRGVHSSFGRKGATSDRSLMFFPKGTDMIGDEFRSQTRHRRATATKSYLYVNFK